MYPRSWTMLVAYLKKYPVMKVKLPNKEFEHTFQSCDGIKINFTSPEGHLVSFGCQGQGVISGKIEYNEDGFTRSQGNMVAWYYYTGPKPWLTSKPEWQQKVEDWDEVLKGLKGFAD